MKSSIDGPKFEEDIFPAELVEISKGRRTRKLGSPKFSTKPSVTNGLIGLALSGGGIRSATFSLGVIQALIEKGKFKIKGYDGLFEIKVEYSSNIYRISCCFDEGNLVVLFQGFQKKTQKTPKK